LQVLFSLYHCIMNKIKIQVVLAEINQNIHPSFSIRYVKKDGTLGEKKNVRKSGKTSAQAAAVCEDAKSDFRYNVKQKGIILLYDMETEQSFSLKIALLTHFNGKQIQH
jgi:hypothetical protein